MRILSYEIVVRLRWKRRMVVGVQLGQNKYEEWVILRIWIHDIGF